MADAIRVEIAYAEPSRQFLRVLALPVGSTIADAIAASGLDAELGIDSSQLDCGIWSKRAARDTELRDGDRVELYRALAADPKEARRRRARQP
ncbi:MAG TPA: RnfH family protein [Rhodanobacteraceae bacterium]|nr:RnfH family protein [Rhodanobacteraceae bacterium]